ncbi:9292_t:CDS:1 [Dentiscutata erythropus]|uniref:9292_t:CDS:1 n=1 Tax=Dentiscutata erythropus TaxID=1348616 RepID=A0A9N9AJ34_9GLOM|nr:9292_t:CDS:1 [Dentiscutata erythropus]
MTRRNNAKISNDHYSKIRPQFPPDLDVQQLIDESVKKHEEGSIRRTPNAFLLYRSQYIAEFNRVKGRNLAATRISQLAKNSWGDEPINVKNFYKQRANDIKKGVKERIPYSFVNENKNIGSPKTNDDGLNMSYGVANTEHTPDLNQHEEITITSNSFQINNEIISTQILDSTTQETNYDFIPNINDTDYTSILHFYPTNNYMPVFFDSYPCPDIYEFPLFNYEYDQSFLNYCFDYTQ